MIPQEYFQPDGSGVLRLLSEAEWRGIGITQSLGWEHYEVHGESWNLYSPTFADSSHQLQNLMSCSSVGPRTLQPQPKLLEPSRIQGGSEVDHYFHQYVRIWLSFLNRSVYVYNSFLFSLISFCTPHHLTTLGLFNNG